MKLNRCLLFLPLSGSRSDSIKRVKRNRSLLADLFPELNVGWVYSFLVKFNWVFPILHFFLLFFFFLRSCHEGVTNQNVSICCGTRADSRSGKHTERKKDAQHFRKESEAEKEEREREGRFFSQIFRRIEPVCHRTRAGKKRKRKKLKKKSKWPTWH